MNFTELQKTVLGSQLRRMKAIVARVEGGKPVCPPKEAPIKVGYQSQAAAHLMAITKKKKYHNEQEAIVADQKRMHSYCTLLAPLEQQSLGRQLQTNAILCRGLG